MAPLPTANLAIVLSVITTDASSNASVSWSCGFQGGTALAAGSTYTLPTGMAAPSTSYVLAQTSYTWIPAITTIYTASVPMSDQIYMNPRNSATIPPPTGGCP